MPTSEGAGRLPGYQTSCTACFVLDPPLTIPVYNQLIPIARRGAAAVLFLGRRTIPRNLKPGKCVQLCYQPAGSLSPHQALVHELCHIESSIGK